MKNKRFYRPDIDGLRALAIIPVILFHAEVTGFSGGFVGVDVFFVISGFLITSIILREIDTGTFSLISFWERRIRRIVPVLFFILACVSIAAYFFVLYPVDFVNFGQSLFAQSVFIANLYFMRQYDYFAGPAESMPLLHTWSLSVEEQFYLIFPILILGLLFVSRKLMVVVLGSLLLISFVYSLFLVHGDPFASFTFLVSGIWGGATNATAGFYFLPARAWELLAGAILAFGVITVRKQFLSEILSILGLIFVVFAVTFLKDTHAFPGAWAILPVIGTVLIIAANTEHDTFVKKLLSFPVFIWVGLISYSLYLWHWPLIVFAKMRFPEFDHMVLASVLVLTFVLSIFTYHIIEKPFRRPTFIKKTWQVYAGGLGMLALLFIAGFYIHSNHGLPGRAPEALQRVSAASVDYNPRQYECFKKNYREIWGESDPCLLGVRTTTDEATFVLWGDSHSDALMPAVDKILAEQGETGVFFGTGGCMPIVMDTLISEDPKCEQIKKQAVSFINENDIEKVLLVGNWVSDEGELVISNAATSRETDSVSFEAGIQKTIELLDRSVDVFILLRIPIFETYSVRELFNRSYADTSRVILPTISLIDHQHATRYETRAFEKLAQDERVTLIDPTEVICPLGKCKMVIAGDIIYANASHINTEGALSLKGLLLRHLDFDEN